MLGKWKVNDFMINEPLINTKKNKQIVAYDIFGRKHNKWLKDFMFRISAYGVLKINDEVLVQRNSIHSKYGFPGGGVEMDESISEGLIREYKEESGLKINVGKLLGISEDFFTFKGSDVHGILVYYEVQKIGGKILLNGNGHDTNEGKFIKFT